MDLMFFDWTLMIYDQLDQPEPLLFHHYILVIKGQILCLSSFVFKIYETDINSSAQYLLKIRFGRFKH